MAAAIVNLKEALESKIKDTQQMNELPRGGFLSEETLDEILSVENIEENLRQTLPKGAPQQGADIESLALDVHGTARKLYATLLLIGEPSRIKFLLEKSPPVNDNLLFTPVDKLSNFCPLEKLQKHLSADIAIHFYEKQWHLPHQLSEAVTHEFPPQHYIFPFKERPEHIGAGSYGSVCKVSIPRSYLMHRDANQSGNELVYKRIRLEATSKQRRLNPKAWERLKIEVKTLRARPHKNITPLFASFMAGMEKPSAFSRTHECLYMISPCARMSMHDWMMQEPEYISSLNHEQYQEHLYRDALLGLAEGVAFIHREDHNGQVGYHRDLKPKNILLFDGPARVWKICDFGCANLKSIDDTGTLNLVTDAYWAPEEVHEARFETDSETHGRPHDVFSLGCVFLLLATLRIFRWTSDGIEEFQRLRESSIQSGSRNTINGKAHAFHNTMNVVREWMDHLRQAAPRDDRDKISLILDLIAEMLQVRGERLYSWEVVISLRAILDPEWLASATKEEIKTLVQPSRTLDSEIMHNPFKRADRKEWPSPVLDALKETKWYIQVPGSTEELKRRKRKVARYHSTLPPVPYDKLFGFHKLNKVIAETFATKANSVALFGLGGMGKSSIAFYYASQFIDIEDRNLRRHTFWINATSVEALQASYQDMFHTIENLDLDPQDGQLGVCLAVKRWLEDDTNGPWILVVDGLGPSKAVKDFLPKRESGQILFTTRSRAHVHDTLVFFAEGAIIAVDRPDDQDCLRILQRDLDPVLIDGSNEHLHDLFSFLWCPQMIKTAARYMNSGQISVRELLKDIQDDGFSVYENFEPDFHENLLKDLFGPLEKDVDDLTIFMQDPSSEVQALVLLAFFDKEGVDLKVLKARWKGSRWKDFRRDLGLLHACRLVSQIEGGHSSSYYNRYSVGEPVRSAIVAWIDKQEGKLGLLKRYNSALSTMYMYYDRSKRAEKKRRVNNEDQPPRAALMPHFELFVKFVLAKPGDLSYMLDDNSVKAVTNFTRVLLDRDRHKDAIKVLEFVQQHYPPSDNNDQKNSVRFWLGEQLVRAYLAHPQDENTQVSLYKAEALASRLSRDATSAGADPIYWAGNTLAKWQCSLNLARVYWKSGRIPKAWTELEPVKAIMVRKGYENAELPKHDEEGSILERSTTTDSTALMRIRKLSMKARFEEGLVRLAEAQSLARQGDSEAAKRSWCAARSSFEVVKCAVEGWFPGDRSWVCRVCVSLADATMKIGSPEELLEAEKALIEARQTAHDEIGDGRKVWDIECKLNALWLELGDPARLLEAERSSRRLLQCYENLPSRDKDAEERCAKTRVVVLQRLGRNPEAQELGKRFPMVRPIANVAHDQGRRMLSPTSTVVSLAGIFGLLLGIWFFC